MAERKKIDRTLERESQQVYGFGYRMKEFCWQAFPYAVAGGATWFVGNQVVAYLNPEHASNFQEVAEDGLFVFTALPPLCFLIGAVIYWGAKGVYDNQTSKLPTYTHH